MSSSEPFNFGRKIKELKRIHKKGYADLTVGLKISRDRLLQLEENEREPNEAERRRFAAFYNLPVEEFGLVEGGTPPPVPAPAPTPAPRPTPGPVAGPGPNTYNTYNPGAGERRFDNPPYQGGERQGGFQGGERQGGFQGGERQGGGFQERSGNFQGGERQGGFQDRRPNPNYGSGPGGGRPSGPPPGGPQRPGYGSGPGGGGGRPSGPPPGGPRPGPNGARQDAPPRRDPAVPKEPKEPKSGEAKPIMKYTAEQLGDIESAYLRKQRDLKVPLTFTFLNGKQYTGVVLDFTPFTVHIQESDSGQEVILRKLAMAYYRKADSSSSGDGDGAGKD